MDRESFVDFIGKCRPLLKEQLQKDVIDMLNAKHVLTAKEYSSILSYKSREGQIIALLDILPSKDEPQLLMFVKYIADWYIWIATEARNKVTNAEMDEKDVTRILDYAEVPRLPPRYVRREVAYLKLSERLHQVKPNEYVLVYGMRGCGKTTLISDVLRDNHTLVKDIFQEHVYWLSVGRLSTSENEEILSSPEELAIQQELCMKMITRSDFGTPSLPMDTKSARKYLRDRLRKSELENCLLVLDDVPSSSFIEALEIGCKILVTTDKKNIMDGTDKTVHYVKVSDGFTPEETLKLFALNLGQNSLPLNAKNHAENLHTICKGFPLTISLISSQLGEYKEDALVNTNRWNVYITELRKKNVTGAIGNDKNRQERLESLYSAIRMSINSLENDLRDKYRDFALFMDDVNIKPEVLCTLWDLSKKSVEDIMREYERKCLAVRVWNETKKTYVFCIHDLLLDYLKRLNDKSQTQELHQKLIRAYQKKYGENFINFPVDDNYIFLYIGHHLKEANMVDQFPRLYFDFKFIEKKISNNGAADLLLDYKKYEQDLVKSCDDNKVLQDFVNFIKHVGACVVTSDCDIVQFGLCEPKNSSVFKQATRYVNELRSNKRHIEREYFELLTDIPRDNTFPVRQYVRETVETATFADNANFVIFATPDGVIQMISLKAGADEPIAKFKHHTKKVTRLQCAKNTFLFLSASYDCTVGIWYFDYSSTGCSSDTEKPRTPSPLSRQADYCDVWPETRLSGISPVTVLKRHTDFITCASFSENSNYTCCRIVTAGEDCRVIVWKIDGIYFNESIPNVKRVDHQVFETKEVIKHCVFGDDDTVLCASTGSVFMYRCSSGNKLLLEVPFNCEIISISTIPNKSRTNITTLILEKDSIRIFELCGNTLAAIDTANRQWETKRRRESTYVCGTISWDGKYSAIATSDHTVRIKDTSTWQRIAKLSEINGDLRGLCWSRENSLLAWYRNIRQIITWRLADKLTKNDGHRLNSSKFDASWIQNCEEGKSTTLVVAAVSNGNDLKIFFDGEEGETIKIENEISDVVVCPMSGNIVYSTINGHIFYVNLREPIPIRIMSIRCIRTCKLKLFSRGKGVLIALLVEYCARKFSLVGLPMNEDTNVLPTNTGSNPSIYYENESNVPIVDFYVDSITDRVYVMRSDNRLNIYDVDTAALVENKQLQQDDSEMCRMKYCDISIDFSSIAYGTDSKIILAKKSNRQSTINFEKLAEICRFSAEGKFLAVGFNDGTFCIYDCENGREKSFFKEPGRVSGKVLEFYWSPFESVLMVIQNMEICLYEIKDYCKLRAVLYFKVDKLISNKTFDGSVTVDNQGRLVVIRHPVLENFSHSVL